MNGLFGEPLYNPPYENWLEDLFAWNAVKYLSPDADLVARYPVDTIGGTVRLDFVVMRGGQKVAFQFEGHDHRDSWPNEWRDALVLGSNAVDAIYR